MAKKSIKTGKLGSSRMPGFYAEASLYNASVQYRAAGILPVSTETRVLPQFVFCGRIYCCDDSGNCFRKPILPGSGGGITIM